MRPKYHTRGIVLTRAPLGEANALVTLLTEDVGLVRARAQGIRKPGAKLAAALATFAESDLILLRGAEGWRISGASLREPWFTKMPRAAHGCAARVVGLFLRLVAGESVDPHLFTLLTGFFHTLQEESEEADTTEYRTVLELLQILGLDTGETPPDRSAYIARINRGITASGL